MARREFKNYAAGLLAASSDPLETWRELEQVSEVVGRTPLVRQVLLGASVETRQARRSVIDKTFHGFSPLMRQFIDVVVRDGYISDMTAIARDYLRRLKAKHDVTEVVIETPRALSDDEQRAITDRLDPSGKVLATQIVRPDLIGGLKVIIDDTEHDFSIDGALSSLKQQLTT